MVLGKLPLAWRETPVLEVPKDTPISEKDLVTKYKEMICKMTRQGTNQEFFLYEIRYYVAG